jgi:hypothetical protein
MTLAIDLDLYTDSVAMRALLQAQLPGFAEGSLRIDALGVCGARRNTSRRRNPRRMTVCYELSVSEPGRGRVGTQLLYAEVFRDAAEARACARQDGRHLTTPPFGEPLVHLAGLNLLLWALPNDPGLPQLSTLLDPLRVARLLPVQGRGAWQVELLRYEPRQRATLRYTMAGGAAPRTVYAKTFRDERAAVIDARFTYFWQLAQADSAAPLVAQPLGHDAALRTLWQAPAQGTPLRGLLAGADGPRLMGRVARALERVHAAPLAPLPGTAPRSAAHWMAEVHRRRNKLGRVDAALGDRVQRAADALGAQADRQALRPLTLIHGDCHPEQVWVQGDRVVLFDFDEFCLGDPMEDLAEFVVKFEQDGAAPALVAAFTDAYAAAAPQRFDRASLAWHLAIQSLLQASRAFIYQQPGWADTLARRLAACEARAAALLAGTPT